MIYRGTNCSLSLQTTINPQGAVPEGAVRKPCESVKRMRVRQKRPDQEERQGGGKDGWSVAEKGHRQAWAGE